MNEHVTSLDLLISEHKRKNSQLSEEIKGHDELSPLERKLLDRENILVKSIEQDVSYLKLFVQGMILTSASTVSASSQESNSSDRVDSGLGTLSPINPSTIPSTSLLSPGSSPEVNKASTISLTKTPSQSPLLNFKMANYPEKPTIKFESPKFNNSRINPSKLMESTSLSLVQNSRQLQLLDLPHEPLPADYRYMPISLPEPKATMAQTTQKKKKSKNIKFLKLDKHRHRKRETK